VGIQIGIKEFLRYRREEEEEEEEQEAAEVPSPS
jgi:hypothetical protein